MTRKQEDEPKQEQKERKEKSAHGKKAIVEEGVAKKAKEKAAAGMLSEGSTAWTHEEAVPVIEKQTGLAFEKAGGAKESGAPEFAQLSALSLLEANEFAVPADVNAFFELHLPPGTDVDKLSDENFRELLERKKDFSIFVAKRLIRESADSVLSRPVGPNSILERALEMHPKTKEHVQAIDVAARESERIGGQITELKRGLDQLNQLMNTFIRTGLGDQAEVLEISHAQLEGKLTVLKEEKEANTTLREQLEAQSEVGRDELEASYRAEMVALSERLGETLEAVAGNSSEAIGQDAQGQLQLDIEKLSNEGKKELASLLEQTVAEISLGKTSPEHRQKELNLRLLLEVDWMQDFTHQYLQYQEPKKPDHWSGADLWKPEVPLMWFTMVDVLKTSAQERKQDSAVLSKFLATESYLFSRIGRTNIEGTRIPHFQQEMPSILSLVVEGAKSDDQLAKELFSSGGWLIENRLRTVYSDRVLRSARDPVITDVQSIARNLGPKYRTDSGFQELVSRVVRAADHQTNEDQQERLYLSIESVADDKTKKVLGDAIAGSLYRGSRSVSRETAIQAIRVRRAEPRFSRLLNILHRVDPKNDLIRDL